MASRESDITTLSIPAPGADDHKGARGRLLLIGGSRSYGGAAVLAVAAAARGGTGWIEAAVPRSIAERVATVVPEAILHPQRETASGRLAAPCRRALCRLIDRATAVAVGPGLGRSEDLDRLVPALLAHARVPVVIDADGLNALAPLRARLAGAARVLTPHPGEAARLLGVRPADVQDDRGAAARELADRSGCVVVLKGHGTVIDDGDRSWVVDDGNPGLATAGTGDVLTGVLGALLAQGLSPTRAARAAVTAHARAGDRAALRHGEIGLKAGDLLEELGPALRELVA